MSNELATQTRSTGFDLSPQTFEQALTFAQYLADSDMVPKDFRGKPANCLIGMQWGMELGMKPLQAIQNIAVINGRPCLWGDAMLAMVRASPLCEYVTEGWLDDGTGYCKAKRRNEPEQIRTFSDADAKLAGLLGKQGPWMTGPKRMRQLRARGFALRDVFTDVLRGMGMAEEAIDTQAMSEKHMGAAVVVQDEKPECWPDDLFKQRLPDWRKAIAEGRATADSIIAKAKTKHPLTDAQMAAVRDPEKATDPGLKPGEVSRQMDEAQDIDALNEAAALINLVRDPEARSELDAEYNDKLSELNT